MNIIDAEFTVVTTPRRKIHREPFPFMPPMHPGPPPTWADPNTEHGAALWKIYDETMETYGNACDLSWKMFPWAAAAGVALATLFLVGQAFVQ